MWRKAINKVALDLERDWLMLFGTGAMTALALFCANVYVQLSVARPLLFFILINGEPPPVCGLCVLFGTHHYL
jgi:hypothetical protein